MNFSGMMQKLTILSVAAFLSSCTFFYPPDYKAPPGLIYQNTSLNRHITTPSDLGNRSGSSCVRNFFWLVSTGNGSIQAAAASKGIRTIKAVDYQVTSLLFGMYTRICTIAHGE